MRYAPPIARLLEELERLPGIGPKSAQRIAYWLLTAESADAERLAGAITEVKRTIHFCPVCFNFAEGDLCSVCSDPERDRTAICVVEEPRDLVAVDRTGEFRGTYHVLQGAISPMDGIGPERLRIRELIDRLGAGRDHRGRHRHQPQRRGGDDRALPRPPHQAARHQGHAHRERACRSERISSSPTKSRSAARSRAAARCSCSLAERRSRCAAGRTVRHGAERLAERRFPAFGLRSPIRWRR